MDNKQRYIALCEQEKIHLFQQPIWLDATTNGNWDVALVEKGGLIIGAMPYVLRERFGKLVYLSQPSLTQFLGPWIKPSSAKYAKRLAYEKDVMTALIDQLPSYTIFSQNWHYSYQNWLPFCWKGFEQTTGYTYVLEDLSDLDGLFNGFQENIRREIRKAQNRFELTVKNDAPLKDFLRLNQMVFARQDMDVPDSTSFIEGIVAALEVGQCVKWFVAYDTEKRSHAGVLIVWDKNSAYYLLGGGDPELRNSGATSLCMWEAIKFASTVTKRFDFEGSMIEPIERFFRGFGAVQKPYFKISHTPSKALRFVKAIRSLR